MSEICDVCGLEYWDEGAGNAVRCESLRGWRGSDPEEAQCLRRGYERLQREVAAAEERGRRAGIEERDGLRAVRSRITEYLAHGGLFNPDLMDHSAVSRLLQDAGIAIDAALAPRDSGKERATQPCCRLAPHPGCEGWAP